MVVELPLNEAPKKLFLASDSAPAPAIKSVQTGDIGNTCAGYIMWRYQSLI